MKAVARMYRTLSDGEKREVEAAFGEHPKAEISDGETISVELWHGPCLESVIEVVQHPGRPAMVSLLEKKVNRANAPPEAIGRCRR